MVWAAAKAAASGAAALALAAIAVAVAGPAAAPLARAPGRVLLAPEDDSPPDAGYPHDEQGAFGQARAGRHPAQECRRERVVVLHGQQRRRGAVER